MIYEVKVNELADEFGVHRNTIRNWINSGVLPAQEGPGRRYLIQWEDYKRLCDRYGREPKIAPEPAGKQELPAIRATRGSRLDCRFTDCGPALSTLRTPL